MRIIRLLSPNSFHGCANFISRLLTWSLASFGGFTNSFALFICRGWMSISFPDFPGVMKGNMLTACHELKIFYSVIEDITIDMMHNFTAFKSPSNVLLHDVSMLEDFPVAILDKFTAVVYPAFLIRLAPSNMRRNSILDSFGRLLISFFGHDDIPFEIIIPCSGFINSLEVVS
jgi:hypothetical protein